MDISAILAFLTLLGVGMANWSKPHTIYESDDPIYHHAEYFDTFTSKTHIVFVMVGIDGTKYYYMRLSANGETTAPKCLLEKNATSLFLAIPSITGSNDGKHIYIALNAMRAQNEKVPEVYFTESNNEGDDFSDPIIPRSNDIGDTHYRWDPNIVHTKADRLLIAYRKDGIVTYTMRVPDSTVWSNERSLRFHHANALTQSTISYPNENNNECICIAALYYYGNPLASYVVFYNTTTNGADWDSYDYQLKYDDNRSLTNIALVYSPTTHSVLFSPLGNQDNNMAVIYQWTNSGVKMIAPFPISSSPAQPTIKLCNINGSPYIFSSFNYFLQNYQQRFLVQFPEEQPYAFERLPPPYTSFDDYDIQLYCHNNTLVAIMSVLFSRLVAMNYTLSTVDK